MSPDFDFSLKDYLVGNYGLNVTNVYTAYYIYKLVRTTYQIDNPYFANENKTLPRFVEADFQLVENDNGISVTNADGKVLALVPLPIAGLMNDLPVEEMADLISKLDDAWKEMGCVINSPYMTMALIPLACLPELRLTNRGLVDCRSFQFVDLFAE